MSSEFKKQRDEGSIAENEPERLKKEYRAWDSPLALC